MAQVEVIDYQINGILEAMKQAKSFKEQMELVRKELSIKAPGLKYTEKELENLTRATVNLGKGLDDAADKGNKFARNLKEAFRNIGKEALSEGGLKGGLAGIAGGIIGGGIVGAIGTVVDLASQAASAFYNWATAEDEVQRASREMSEAIVQASAAFADEAVALDSNFAILSDTTMSYEDRQLALDNLNESYPEYFSNIDLDKTTNEELQAAYDGANASLQKRIEIQANTELATKKYTEAIEKQQQAMQQLENIGDISNNTWTDWIRVLTGNSSQIAINAEKAAKLNKESNDVNNTYQKLIKTVTELTAAENKRRADAEKAAEAEKARLKKIEDDKKASEERAKEAQRDRQEAAKEAAKDFEEANRRAIEASKSGTEAEAEDNLKRAQGYRDLAAAKVEAAKSIGDTGTKSNQQLKDEAADAANVIVEANKTIDSYINNIRFSEESRAAADRNALREVVKNGGDVFEFFKKLAADGQVVFDKSLEAFKNNVNEQIIGNAKIIKNSEGVIKENARLLEEREKQEEATSTNLVELDKKLADTRLQVQKNLAERSAKAQQELTKTAIAAAEAVSKGIIDAGSATFQQLVQANLDIAEANFEQGLTDLEARFRASVKGISDLEDLGGLLDFTRERGFFLKAGVELEEETAQQIAEIIASYNTLYSQLEADRDREKAQAQQKAAKQTIEQVKRLNAEELELEKEKLENRKFALDQEKNARLKAIKDLRDPLLKAGKELTDEQIAQAKRDGERFAAEARGIAEDEAAALTGPFFDALNKAIESGDAQAAQEALLQFINERNAILKNGNDQAEAINQEFTIVPKEEDQEEKLRKILNLAVQYAQQVAELINGIFDLVAQRQQNVVDSIQEQLDAVSSELDRTISRINELEGELADERSGRRDAVLRGIENEKQREEVLAQQKLRLQQRLAAEEKRLANIRKAQAISQAVINGALAITQSFAQLGPIAGAIAAVITAATTATQIALIAQQKFAKGGYTGNGSGNRDETGYKVAGVVHEGEYVVPKWMVESPKYAGTIASLEAERTGGYAEGGFATANYSSLSDSAINRDNIQLARIMTKYAETNLALADRPLFVTATEVTNVATNQARKVNATTIGGR